MVREGKKKETKILLLCVCMRRWTKQYLYCFEFRSNHKVMITMVRHLHLIDIFLKSKGACCWFHLISIS